MSQRPQEHPWHELVALAHTAPESPQSFCRPSLEVALRGRAARNTIPAAISNVDSFGQRWRLGNIATSEDENDEVVVLKKKHHLSLELTISLPCSS